MSGQSSARTQVALQGPDLDRLAEYATRITDELRKVPGAVDVDNSLVVGKPELRAYVESFWGQVLDAYQGAAADSTQQEDHDE